MILKDIMTRDVVTIGPEETCAAAAAAMKDNNVGCLPVCDDRKILGVVTDRDLVVRMIAEERDPQTCQVRDVMSAPVTWCYEEVNVGEAARLMEIRQIRRLIVINQHKKLVGVVSLGDVATKANEQVAGEALERISEPPPPVH